MGWGVLAALVGHGRGGQASRARVCVCAAGKWPGSDPSGQVLIPPAQQVGEDGQSCPASQPGKEKHADGVSEGEEEASQVKALETVLCWAGSVRAQSPWLSSCWLLLEGVWQSDKYQEPWGVCCGWRTKL